MHVPICCILPKVKEQPNELNKIYKQPICQIQDDKLPFLNEHVYMYKSFFYLDIKFKLTIRIFKSICNSFLPEDGN